MKTFYFTVQGGDVVLPKLQEESRKLYLASMEGKQGVETLKLWRPQKSHNQVKAIFGLALGTIKREFDDRGWGTSLLLRTELPTGVAVSTWLVKEYLYAVCPIFDDHGNAITLSHKDCTTDKAAKFFNDIQAWAASQWQIYIQDPDPGWAEKKERQ